MRLAAILACAASLLAAEPRAAFGRGAPFTVADLPDSALKAQLRSLPAAASARALHTLHRVRLHAADLAHVRADADGEVYHQCAALGAGVTAAAAAPVAAAAATATPVAPVWHSRPGCPRIVVLDVNGWTGTWPGDKQTYDARPYDQDGDLSSFSDSEVATIRRMYERLAEDLAPFDVDVTTEDLPSGPSVGRVLVTHARDRSGKLNPGADRYGGLAYIGVYGWTRYAEYQPAWVYYTNLPNEDVIAETCAHEIGHNLGLSHDGNSHDTYDRGCGSGQTSWGPIMGAPWYRSVTQWSNGAYADATNKEDDLSIIAGMLGWADDDHDDVAAPTHLSELKAHGVIGANDRDALRFHHDGGVLELRVDPYVCERGTCGGNLDVRLELRSAGGDTLLVSDPVDSTSATIQQQLAAGDYTLVVSGAAGPNAPAYGSLGQWSLNGGTGVLTTSGRPAEVYDGSGAPQASPGGGDGGDCGFGGIAGLLLGFVGLALRRR